METEQKDRQKTEHEGGFVKFGEKKDSNQEATDPIFEKGRQKDLDVYYLSQSYFVPTKTTIRNNSNIKILIKQTLDDMESFYQGIAEFVINHDDIKDFCREAREH